MGEVMFGQRGSGLGTGAIKNSKVQLTDAFTKDGLRKHCFVARTKISEVQTGPINTTGTRFSSKNRQYSGAKDPLSTNIFKLNDSWGIFDLSGYGAYWYQDGTSSIPKLVSFRFSNTEGVPSIGVVQEFLEHNTIYNNTQYAGFPKFLRLSDTEFLMIYRLNAYSRSGPSTLFCRRGVLDVTTGAISLGTAVVIFTAADSSGTISYSINYDIRLHSTVGNTTYFVVSCGESYASKLTVMIGSVTGSVIAIHSTTVVETGFVSEIANPDWNYDLTVARHRLFRGNGDNFVILASKNKFARGWAVAFSVNISDYTVAMTMAKVEIGDTSENWAIAFVPFQETANRFLVFHNTYKYNNGSVTDSLIRVLTFNADYSAFTLVNEHFPGNTVFDTSNCNWYRTDFIRIHGNVYGVMGYSGLQNGPAWSFAIYDRDKNTLSPVSSKDASSATYDAHAYQFLSDPAGSFSFSFRYTSQDSSYRTCEYYIHASFNLFPLIEESGNVDSVGISLANLPANSGNAEYPILVPQEFSF